MKANEIRVGNLVEWDDDEMKSDKRKVRVEAHHMNSVEFFNPIPLTEEILLRCGFEKHHPEGDLYSLPWILTSLHDGKEIDKNFSVALFDGFFVACQCQNTHLRYLHELQNLFYFTAQGQELNTSGL